MRRRGRRNLFLKREMEKSEESREFVLPDDECQPAAAIQATVAEDKCIHVGASSQLDAPPSEGPSSLAVDLECQPQPLVDSDPRPATFWRRLQTGWSEVEDRLAEWFGLDQSKYQWAVDELLERQLTGDHPASKVNVVELQMQEIQEQRMERDLKESSS